MNKTSAFTIKSMARAATKMALQRNQRIEGTRKNNELKGGKGADTISGGRGDDRLAGGAGADILKGGKGKDTLDGGKGSDLLIGKGGNDVYELSSGNDTIQGYQNMDRIQLSTELIAAGIDKKDIKISAKKQNRQKIYTLEFAKNGVEGKTLVHGALNEPQVYGSYSSWWGTEQNDDFWGQDLKSSPIDIWGNGSGGNDTIRGHYQNDTLLGGKGNDKIEGKGGSDNMFGDDGDDKIFAHDNSFKEASTFNDRIDGGNGNDHLKGEIGNDFLLGSAGNDTLMGGEGRDTLQGDGGDDTYHADHLDAFIEFENSGYDKLYLESIGSNGFRYDNNVHIEELHLKEDVPSNKGKQIETNYLDNTVYGNANHNDLRSWGGNDTVKGKAGNDTIYGGADDDRLEGGDDNDYISGDSGNDEILGESGKDTLIGGSGNDYLVGHSNDDKLEGGGNNDTIYGDKGNDEILGESGKDTLEGGAGDDVIKGGKDDDTIDGGDDDDTIDGGEGDDELTGGDGVDQFVIGLPSNGDDIIEDFDPKQEVLVFESPDLLRFTEVKLGGETRSLKITRLIDKDNLDEFKGSVILKGVSFEDFSTALNAGKLGVSIKSNQVLLPIKNENGSYREFVRTLNEGIEDDYNNIVGTDNGDTIESNASMRDDADADNPGKFIGSEKADYMQGLEGNDQLFGKDGDDLLNGGTGADTLNGGDGNDDFIVGLETAVIDAGDGKDSFENNDKALGFQNIKMGEGEDTLTNIGQLKVDGNINMGAGDDILTTNLFIDADKLSGGSGKDTLILNDQKQDGITRVDWKESDGFKIRGFETIQQTGGTWEYEGKFKKTDALIERGKAEVKLSSPDRAGFTVKSFKIGDGGKLIIDTSAINQDNRDAAWTVIQGKVDNVDASNTLLNVDGKNYSMDNQSDDLIDNLGGTPELAITDKGLMLSILI